MKVKTEIVNTTAGARIEATLTNPIDKWTNNQKLILMAMVRQGKSYAEIGVELKRSPSSCRSMYQYAKLREKITGLERRERLLMEQVKLRDNIIAGLKGETA